MIRLILAVGLCIGAVCLHGAEKGPPQGQTPTVLPQSTQQYLKPIPMSTITLHPGTLDVGSIPANPTLYAVGVVAGFVPLDSSAGASNLVDAAVA